MVHGLPVIGGAVDLVLNDRPNVCAQNSVATMKLRPKTLCAIMQVRVTHRASPRPPPQAVVRHHVKKPRRV